jgi:hypothetical protein
MSSREGSPGVRPGDLTIDADRRVSPKRETPPWRRTYHSSGGETGVKAASDGLMASTTTTVLDLAEREGGFRSRVRELESLHAELWQATDARPPCLGERVAPGRQEENERAAEGLLEEVARLCEAWPRSEASRRAWREDVRERVREFGERRLGWPDGYRSLLMSEDFYASTAEFVRAARAFDPHVRLEDVTQALRNVWIMNSLQLLFGLEVAFSSAIFGYSMLYPCTDNFLDDPHVSPPAKARFNRRLERRLRGEKLLPRTAHEQQAFALVQRIERQHSRKEAPGVFQSLRAIQQAQQASLAQQRPLEPPDEERVLAISVAKGGASLLADGYLVRGELGPEEEELCFGYGVFLQLLDDLQDVSSDRDVGHTTLFTIAAREGTLDAVTGRLHGFMERIMGRWERWTSPERVDGCDLVLRNCTFLMVGSIARHRRLFGRRFLEGIEERWPLTLAAMSRLGRKAERLFRRVGRELSRRNGMASPVDLL